MKRLRGTDAYAIYSETPTSPFVTLKVAIYSPVKKGTDPDSLDFRTFIKDNIAALGATRAAMRILRVPFDLHHPVWLRAPGFNADDHIYEVELPAPGGQAELCDFLSELMSKPLDYERPLWEVWVVKGLEGGRIAVAFKIQHALADGKTMARMIEMSHSSSAGADKPADYDVGEEPVPGKARLVGDALVDLARSYTEELPNFYRHLKRARQRAAAVKEATDKLVAPFSAPYNLLNARAGGSARLYRYASFPLADIKAVARHYGCTINTLVLGICSEVLTRYLEEAGDLPDKPLITAMPMGDPDDSGPSRLLDSDIHNNHLGVAILSLHNDIEDFGERLAAIGESSRAAIEHVHHEEGRRFDNYMDYLPGTAIRMINASMYRRQRKKRDPYANVVISNVPGPRKTLYAMDGLLRMEELLSVGNLMDTGHLNITVWSYVDKLAFSLFMREGALPDPERLLYHLRQVVAEVTGHDMTTDGATG